MNILARTFLLIGLAAAVNARSQTAPVSRDFVAFSWEPAFPSDNNYLSESSLSGWRVEYRKMIKPNLSVGIAGSWNAFEEYINTRTYKSADGTGAVTTDMIRQVYTVPITLIGHYYFQTSNRIIQPYVGIGLGTQYAEQNTYFNIYESIENSWGFVARPEVGALFRLGPSRAKMLLSVGYNVATNDNEVFDVNGMKHITVNVGIGIGN